MSLKNCLDTKVKSGRIDAAKATEIEARLGEYQRVHETYLGPDAALRAAELDLVKAMTAEQARIKDLLARQVITQDRVLRAMEDHPKGSVAGLLSLLSRDWSDQHGTANVEKLRESIRGLSHSMLAEGLERFRVSFTGGARDAAGQANVVRALFGQRGADTNANEIADAWTPLAEYLRQRAVAAGIDIAKLESWAMPNPSWDARAVGEAGFEKWRAAVEPHLSDKTFQRMDGRKSELLGDAQQIFDEIKYAQTEQDRLSAEASAKRARLRARQDSAAKARVALDTARGELAALAREGQDTLSRYIDNRPTRPYEDGRQRRTSAEVVRDKKRAPHAREARVAIERLEQKRMAARKKIGEANGRLREAEADIAGLTERLGQIDTHAADWAKRIGGLQARRTLVGRGADALPAAIIDEAAKTEFLRHVYDTLRTDGLSKLQPAMTGGSGLGRKLANRHKDAHRVLHFKDGEGWLAVQQAFGRGSPVEALTGHMDRMANEIAWAETWGPNPEAIKTWAIAEVERGAALSEDPKAYDKLQGTFGALQHFKNTWDDVSGLTSTPVNERVSRISSNLRSVQVSAQLGSAFISSLTDAGSMAITAAFNGLPVMGVLGRSLKLLVDSGDRAAAVRLGLVAEGWTRVASGGMRYAGEALSDGWAGRLAHMTMRASLLGPATEARQWAFGMEFLGALADHTGSDWTALPKRLRGALDRYGLDAEAWQVIRTAPMFEHDGAKFLDVQKIARVDHERAADVAATVHRMVLTERDYAVVTSDPRTRAILQQGTQTGTVVGELMRHAGMYKAFGVTVMTTHLGRAMAQKSVGGRLGYAAAFFASTTVLGMAAWQAKHIIKGRDPATMDPSTAEGRASWGAAMMQGGGLGIFGDFLFSEDNRLGGGLAETLAGPTAGMAGDAIRLTVGNARTIASGETPDLWRQVVQMAGRYTPGSSLWYGRLAFERAILDQLAALDPETQAGWRRMEKRMRSETGQELWWKRGELAPRRPPDMAAAVE